MPEEQSFDVYVVSLPSSVARRAEFTARAKTANNLTTLAEPPTFTGPNRTIEKRKMTLGARTAPLRPTYSNRLPSHLGQIIEKAHDTAGGGGLQQYYGDGSVLERY